MSSLYEQDITVGNPAKAQLARAVRNPEEAFNTMKGSFFVVETKFDGAPLPLMAVEVSLPFLQKGRIRGHAKILSR